MSQKRARMLLQDTGLPRPTSWGTVEGPTGADSTASSLETERAEATGVAVKQASRSGSVSPCSADGPP